MTDDPLSKNGIDIWNDSGTILILKVHSKSIVERGKNGEEPCGVTRQAVKKA
jgi:hypothetical protein